MQKNAKEKAMLQNNVCLVPPYRTDARSLHTLHLVRETVRSSVISCKESVYKLYFVERGEGKLTVRSREYELREGDLFFTFPAMPYTLSFEGEHSFVYVSFLGTRANQLMDRLGVGERNLYFRGGVRRHNFAVVRRQDSRRRVYSKR